MQSNEGKTLLVLFDANNLVHRAFHALPPLTVSKTGEQVGAVYGFAKTVFKLLGDLNPTHAAAAFDLPAPTFRHVQFEEYKATRKPTDPELVPQFARVRQFVEALNLPVFAIEGFEADDVLGTLSRQAAEQGIHVTIVSGDMDMLQLVSERVRVRAPGRSFTDMVEYDEAKVQEKYGVKPAQVPDLKALKGDPSDNIPGVPGVGEKTAARLIQEYGSLEGVYAHLSEVAPPKLQESLRASESSARQGKNLSTIVTTVPVTLDISCCPVGNYDRARLVQLCRDLEFYTLLNSIPQPPSAAPAELIASELAWRIAETDAAADGLISELSRAGAFAFSAKLRDRDYFQQELTGAAFCTAEGSAVYLRMPAGAVPQRLSALLADAGVSKAGADIKETIKAAANVGVSLSRPYFDVGIAAHLLGERSLNVKSLALNKLGLELPPEPASDRKQRLLIEPDPQAEAKYYCAYAEAIFRLHSILQSELENTQLTGVFAEIETPLVDVLVEMERNGVAIDTDILRDMSQAFAGELAQKEARIYEVAGVRFNINSPQQLGTILFETLKLPPARRTSKGYSTDASVLEELRSVHPIVDLILGYRQLSKLKSTYLDTLPALVNPRISRLCTTFNQTGTATGRLSSSEPNLQNIPIRGEWGRQIRRAFVAESPAILLGADYSQIDLRVLAHLSQDEGLLSSFRQNEDIHTSTASELFSVSRDKVTGDMRRVAKTVNFGVIYGMSEYGLEQATELSREDAGKYIEKYFQKHPGVARYLASTKEFAHEKGYVQTLVGRRRYIPEVKSSNYQLRSSAERMAINMPVQGTSADVMKIAMVRLHARMKGMKVASRMILQIHDELLFEVPPGEMELMKGLVCEIMPSAMELSVPLKIAVKTGRNWCELE